MKQPETEIRTSEGFGFVGNDTSSLGEHKVWNLIPLEEIIEGNLFEMLSDCYDKIFSSRSLYDKMHLLISKGLNEKSLDKALLISRFAQDCEHAYVIRKERLEKEYINKQN